MDDAVALKRLEALLEGVGADAVCQLCLVELENASRDPADTGAPPTADATCAHRTCARCMATLNLDDGAWGPAGCPSCEMDDTDAGMTRMFGAATGGGEATRDTSADEPSSCRCGRVLLTRESFRGVEAAALAGVFVAERRAVARAVGIARASPSPAGDKEDEEDGDEEGDASAFWGPTPSLDVRETTGNESEQKNDAPRWWDCGAQMISLRDALPSARVFLSRLRLDEDLAIVSNGSALLGSGFGRDIDRGDAAVARFNEYETSGFEDDVGARITAHVTGWLFSARRGDPGDRLAHEEPSEASVEIRLAPNVESLARAYYVSYARAVAHHKRAWVSSRDTTDTTDTTSGEIEILEFANVSETNADDADGDAWWRDRLEKRRAPVAFVAAPSTYARHWTHVRSDGPGPQAQTNAGRTRATTRVTSGYAFLLLALDFAGMALPGVAEEECVCAPPGARTNENEKKKGSVRLYGFEDDPRNARDGAGGHFWDPAHAQHHEIYDLPWERSVARELAATRRGVSRAANPALHVHSSARRGGDENRKKTTRLKDERLKTCDGEEKVDEPEPPAGGFHEDCFNVP